MVFGWEKFLRISGWTSEFQSVNKLLRYLKYRNIGSESSRKAYCWSLYMFCRFAGKTPDELVAMDKREIEALLKDFAYSRREHGVSARTINTTLCYLVTFFKENGFKNELKLDIEFYRQPARFRIRPEYIPTWEEGLRMAECAGSLRHQAIIYMLMSSGLRNSTLRAILYGDVREELERGEPNILIRVYPEMKKLVPSACKGNIRYFTFISKQATDALRRYVADQVRKFGQIRDQDPLFSSEHNQLPREQRISKPITDKHLQNIVKEAARKAAEIKEWKSVYPHCLRKTFEALLRSPLKDGTRLDFQDQVFLMGHIVPSLEPYYESKVEDLRRKYSKLVFTVGDEKLTKAIEALEASSEFFRVYGSDEASRAIRDVIDEIQVNSPRRDSGMNPSAVSKQNQDRPVCDQSSDRVLPAASTKLGGGSLRRNGSRPKVGGKVQAKINRSDEMSRGTAKQVGLDVFFDSHAPQERRWNDFAGLFL